MLGSRSPIYKTGMPHPMGCPRGYRDRGRRVTQLGSALRLNKCHSTRHYFTITHFPSLSFSEDLFLGALSPGSVCVGGGRATQSQRPARSIRADRLQPGAGVSQGSRTTEQTGRNKGQARAEAPGGTPRRHGRLGEGSPFSGQTGTVPPPPGQQTPRHCSPSIAVLNT